MESMYLALQYNKAIANKISEICLPILQNLGISGFGYVKIFNDGKMFCINPNISWTEHYFTQLSTEDARQGLLREINENKKYLLCANHDSHLKTPLYSACYEFNIWYILIIYEKKHDHVQWCFFHGDRHSHGLLNFYINNTSVLESFIYFFEKTFSDCIITNDNQRLFNLGKGHIDLENNKTISNAYAQTWIKNFPNNKFFLDEFLQETFITKRTLKTRERDINLSKREIECLNFLSLGKSMKEIARNLDLSPRTVEFYLRNIKKKSGLNRGELISHFVSNFSI